MTSPEAPDKKSEVTLSQESMEQLAMMVATVVDQRLKANLNKDTAKVFWGAGIEMFNDAAAEKAKAAAKWGFKAIATRVLFYVLGGMFIFWLGGWDALAKWLKTAASLHAGAL